jgi:hypothetical protein
MTLVMEGMSLRATQMFEVVSKVLETGHCSLGTATGHCGYYNVWA